MPQVYSHLRGESEQSLSFSFMICRRQKKLVTGSYRELPDLRGVTVVAGEPQVDPPSLPQSDPEKPCRKITLYLECHCAICCSRAGLATTPNGQVNGTLEVVGLVRHAIVFQPRVTIGQSPDGKKRLFKCADVAVQALRPRNAALIDQWTSTIIPRINGRAA